MPRWLWPLLCFGCVTAERPAKSYSAALETDGEGPPFGSPDDAVAADSPEDLAAEVPELPGETLNASACPQATVLRSLLKQIGMAEDELKTIFEDPDDPRKRTVITWIDCNVEAIVLKRREDLRGVLSDDLLKLQDLKLLDLSNTGIGGNVATLRKARKLKDVWLQASRVFGDLAVLQNLTNLQQVSFRGSEIHGDLSAAFSNLPEFKFLDLSETKVGGNLAGLPQFPELRRLYLKNTQVFGNLKTLSNIANIRALDLSNTSVSGDISAILKWPMVLEVDLSRTKVTGRLGRSWAKCCQRLHTLRLANTQVKFVPLRHVPSPSWMPALSVLELSGSPLNCSIADLLVRALRLCRSLGNLKAARCGLHGRLPRLGRFAVARALASLDLEGNRLTAVTALPLICQTVILADNQNLTFNPGVLKNALANGVFLDLQNVTFAKPAEVTDLLDTTLEIGKYRTLVNEELGFACFDIVSGVSLRMSPEKFAPERLCSCMPGWIGSGTSCRKCPRNSFKEDYGLGACLPCPLNSSSPAAARSHDSCQCDVGVLFEQNGTWRCGCPKDYARLGKSCVKCDELHLDCTSAGSEAFSASALPGFARLGHPTRAFQCLPPELRCNATGHKADSGPTAVCLKGYSGPLCMDCAATYYATGSRCAPCLAEAAVGWSAWLVAVVVVAVAMVAAWWFSRRSATPTASLSLSTSPTSFSVFKELISAQGPMLLQMCQLWAVLAALSRSKTVDAGGESNADAGEFWEVPYVQALQLSVTNFKSALTLQCNYDGAAVRFALALAAPVIPLLLLLCCLVCEFWRHGLGINLGLQAITLLYIGGARSCSDLLSCQETDGAGDALPPGFAFRQAMPYFWCNDESQVKRYVDLVGYVSALYYALVIPCCLLYLYARQLIALQSSRMIGAAAAHSGDLRVCLYQVRGSSVDPQDLCGDASDRRRLAALTAYVAVLLRGRVELRLEAKEALARPLEGASHSDLWDFLASDVKERSITLKCRSITEMLTERCILQEVEQSDRVLSGAKNLLLKYTLCGNLWMEIVQKLVAVGLVSVVGITLAMAAISGMVQPYLLPQLNTLQCCCFLCLALATLSFDFGWPFLSRSALLLPFVVSALLALATPDSAERLAVRLWQEVEPKLGQLQKGQSVEINAEILSFF